MIKLFIVSNTKNKELAKFLEQRGTFSVEGSYNSISENAVNIQNDILKVDKTLYLYQVDETGGSNINIRSDMQYLQKMLETNSFFDPGEIMFITQNNSQCKQAVKYFMSVMESCQYKKYAVKQLDGVISYMAVYDSLMGNSESVNFDNQYRALYRREKDEESSIAYEKGTNRDELIEPFDFRNIRDYTDQKKLTQKAMSVVKFRDTEDVEIKQFDNPVFNGLNVTSVLDGPNVCVLTGKSKSGLSTWTSALAASSVNGKKNTLVVDYTSNSDVAGTLEENGISVNQVGMKQILNKEFGDAGQVNVLAPNNDKEEKVRLNLIRKIFSDFELPYDNVIIAARSEDFDAIVTLLRGSISTVILTTVPRHADVVEMQSLVDTITGMKVVVVLNECINLKWEKFLTQQEVKDLLVFMNPKVVKSIDFDNLNVGANLFESIMKA